MVRQDCLQSADATDEMLDDQYEYHGQDWEDAANSGVEGDVGDQSSEKTCPAHENVYASILKSMEGDGEQSKGAAAAGGANKSVLAFRDDGPFKVRSLSRPLCCSH